MKQFLVSLFLTGLFIGAVLLADNTYFADRPDPTLQPTPTPILMIDRLVKIDFNEGVYKYAIFKIDDLSKLVLGPNFKEKSGSESIVEKNECKALVSGGFYDTKDDPIGWFLSDGEELNREEVNLFLNGRLQVATDSAVISRKVSIDNIVSGLQSGPLLIVEGKPIDLSIKEDEERRRS